MSFSDLTSIGAIISGGNAVPIGMGITTSAQVAAIVVAVVVTVVVVIVKVVVANQVAVATVMAATTMAAGGIKLPTSSSGRSFHLLRESQRVRGTAFLIYGNALSCLLPHISLP